MSVGQDILDFVSKQVKGKIIKFTTDGTSMEEFELSSFEIRPLGRSQESIMMFKGVDRALVVIASLLITTVKLGEDGCWIPEEVMVYRNPTPTIDTIPMNDWWKEISAEACEKFPQKQES